MKKFLPLTYGATRTGKAADKNNLIFVNKKNVDRFNWRIDFEYEQQKKMTTTNSRSFESKINNKKC